MDSETVGARSENHTFYAAAQSLLKQINVCVLDTGLVVDVNVGNTPELRKRLDLCGFSVGEKVTPGEEIFQKFWSVIEGQSPVKTAGGTGANVGAALRGLLGEEVTIDFLGIVSDSGQEDAQLARDALIESKLEALARCRTDLPEDVALSLIITDTSGSRDRWVLKRPIDNPARILNPELLETESVRQQLTEADLIFMPGNFRISTSALYDAILKKRWADNKILAFALPTDLSFSRADAQHIQWITASANIVLANAEELRAIYGVENRPELDPELSVALNNLQAAFKGGVFTNRNSYREQVGFITDDKRGSYIVTRDGWQHFPANPAEKIVNKVGAGDICFGSFLASYLKGLPLPTCVEVAQQVARIKVGVNAARLPDVLNSLHEERPDLATLFSGSGAGHYINPWRPSGVHGVEGMGIAP